MAEVAIAAHLAALTAAGRVIVDRVAAEEAVESAVDEGLHELMAVVCTPEPDSNGILTPDGILPLGEVQRSIAQSFWHYLTNAKTVEGQ